MVNDAKTQNPLFTIHTEKILVSKCVSAHWEYNHISTNLDLTLLFFKIGQNVKKWGHYD